MGVGEAPGTSPTHPWRQVSPVKWGQSRLCVTCSDNGAITSGKLSSAQEIFVSAKTGLVTNRYHMWETEAQRDEATCPGPLSLLQELSVDSCQVLWKLPRWKRQWGDSLPIGWAKGPQRALSQTDQVGVHLLGLPLSMWRWAEHFTPQAPASL